MPRSNSPMLAVMARMHDKDTHTMQAFPLIEIALTSITPEDFHGHLEVTHSLMYDIARPLAVWARCPTSDRNLALGWTPTPAPQRELDAAVWGATSPPTRDAVHTAALVYGWLPMIGEGGSGPHATLQGRGGSGKSLPVTIPHSAMSMMNRACMDAAAMLPAVRELLAYLPYHTAYTEVMSAQVAVEATMNGVPFEDVKDTVNVAREVVPTFTVNGDPMSELIDAALPHWARPLHVVGLTWEQVRARDRAVNLDPFAHIDKREMLKRCYGG